MHERVLVRILLRILGLYTLGWNAISCVTWAAMMVDRYSQNRLTAGAIRIYSPFSANTSGVMCLVGAALGAYLLFGGRRIEDMCLRGLSGCCFECGYDLAGHNRDACPECGTPLLPSQRTQPDAAPRPPLGQ